MPSPAIPAAGSVEAFLRRARRRALLREVLAAALVSAAADVVLRLGPIAIGRQLSREVPQFFEGIYLFAVLAALAWRRQTRVRVAAGVDRRLRLKDRLVTYLDFRTRAGLDGAFVAAQAAETAAALAPIAPARAVPVPRWLWAGPLALAWMLYLSYFAFFRPQDVPTVLRVARRGLAPSVTPRAPEGKGSPQDSPAPDAERDAGADRGEPGGEGRDRPAGGPAHEALPWEHSQAKSTESAPAAPQGAGPGGEVGEPFTPEGAPAQLFSTKVGAGLTPVAPDVASLPAGARDGEPQQPRGRVAFSLIPTGAGAGRGAGAGSRPGGGRAAGLEITVDFDAVPPELRAYVSRYFEALARRGRGGTDGT